MAKFGPVSKSEIMFFFTRAAVGAGCEFGVGEDVAKAAAWLGNFGFDTATIISSALDGLSAGDGSKPLMHAADNQTMLDAANQGKMSAIYAGIIAGDWLDANTSNSDALICLKNVDDMLLAIAMLWSRSANNTHYQISIGELNNSSDLNEILSVVGSTKKSSDITISSCTTRGQKVQVDTDADIFVDADAWKTIITYFNKCLVPATTQSRLSGAGADFSDND